jgi:predicted RNA binding protein YcfA (HicA-like mRNA interferase family)
MSRLPALTARQMVKALLKAGFLEEHQRGSHLSLCHPVTHRVTVVPMHPGDLHRGLMKAILKQAGLSEEEFRKFL